MKSKISDCSSLIIVLFFLFQNKEVKETFRVNPPWARRTTVHLQPLKRHTSSSLAHLDHSSSSWTACTNSTSPKPAPQAPRQPAAHQNTTKHLHPDALLLLAVTIYWCTSVCEWMKRSNATFNVWMGRQEKYLQIFHNLKGSKKKKREFVDLCHSCEGCLTFRIVWD